MTVVARAQWACVYHCHILSEYTGGSVRLKDVQSKNLWKRGNAYGKVHRQMKCFISALHLKILK